VADSCFTVVAREVDERPVGVVDGHCDDVVDVACPCGVVVERLHLGGIESRHVFGIVVAGVEALLAEERRHLRGGVGLLILHLRSGIGLLILHLHLWLWAANGACRSVIDGTLVRGVSRRGQ
jgi:hypothetical protein